MKRGSRNPQPQRRAQRVLYRPRNREADKEKDVGTEYTELGISEALSEQHVDPPMETRAVRKSRRKSYRARYRNYQHGGYELQNRGRINRNARNYKAKYQEFYQGEEYYGHNYRGSHYSKRYNKTSHYGNKEYAGGGYYEEEEFYEGSNKGGGYGRRRRGGRQKEERRNKNDGRKNQDRRHRRNPYPEHVSEAEALAGIASGKYFAGNFRVNPYLPRVAYVTTESLKTDVKVEGFIEQNRALHKDTVVIELLPMKTWKPVCKQEEKEIEKLDDEVAADEISESESEDESSDGSEKLKEDDDPNVEANLIEEYDADDPTEDLKDEDFKGNDVAEEGFEDEENLKDGKLGEADPELKEKAPKEKDAADKGSDGLKEETKSSDIETNIIETAVANTEHIEKIKVPGVDLSNEETVDLKADQEEQKKARKPRNKKEKKHKKEHNDEFKLEENEEIKEDKKESKRGGESDYKKNMKDIEKMSLEEKVDYINSFNPPLRPAGKVVHILKSPLRSEYFVVGMAAKRVIGERSHKVKNTAEEEHDHRKKQKEAIYIKPTIRHYMKMDVVDQSLITEEDPDEYYLCQYVSWTSDRRVPLGKILRRLGVAGTVDSETLRVLVGFNILPEDLPEAAAEELKAIAPVLDPFTRNIIITEEEKKKRVDLRGKRIFTTDNDDTKDIDDAVHVEKIADNVYELGVHIADVGHYVKDGTALDEQAKAKATSVYLAHRTYPMFPELLTNEICSLNPNVDRYAFSIVFRVDGNGQLITSFKPQIFKSIIKSKSKMSYSLFQGILDGKISSNDDLPEPHKVHGSSIAKNRVLVCCLQSCLHTAECFDEGEKEVEVCIWRVDNFCEGRAEVHAERVFASRMPREIYCIVSSNSLAVCQFEADRGIDDTGK
eukprot:TRINITY_DN689_c0_g3_i10.p1 TRINITY_DN689_c0_g3~~TRINITY_DN689_c0_g3_i10.p1  ORF type:complete len:890 (+),score=221.42 TRINITY_DN689_c0_g3_i10:129-2798(+)